MIRKLHSFDLFHCIKYSMDVQNSIILASADNVSYQTNDDQHLQ